MDSVTLRPWPLKVPASAFGLMQELERRAAALDEREAQIAQREEDARRRGLEQGLREGREEILAQAVQSLDALGAERQALRDEFAARLPELAAALTERILGRELTCDPSALASMVHTLLEENELGPDATLELSGADLPWATAHTDLLEAPGVTFTLVENPDLQPGEVILSTALARVEGTLDVFRRQIEALLDRRSPRGETPAL